MSPPFVQLFVNPHAGRRSRRRTGALRSAFEARGAEVLVSPSRSARLEVDPRADHVCAVGGDGTVRHVVDAVRRARRPITISVYPAGTINLLARECGYPRDPGAFAQRVLDPGGQRPVYAALLGDTPLLACASVGPDSRVVEALSVPLKARIGRAAYIVAFFRLLHRWPRLGLTLIHDGRRTACEAVYVAKGRFFAGPWSFAPHASVREPRLHVVALREASRRTVLRFAWTIWTGRPVERLAGVDCFACTDLTIEGAPAPVQGDGDIVAHLPVRIAVEPDPLRFA